jgi:hypothetical protein
MVDPPMGESFAKLLEENYIWYVCDTLFYINQRGSGALKYIIE